MPFCKLPPGEVVTDHFVVKLHGVDDRVAVGPLGFLGYFPEGDGGQRNQDVRVGSLSVLTGVPDL